MLARNTILESRYRIIRPLGKGGMGQVYEAIDDTIDSIVAIKETLTTSDKLRNAFRHEARTLANLKHPALPRVTHHFFQDDGQFLVMEFIEGLNLAQRLDLRGRPFDYAEVLVWTEKLLSALAYLHNQKPEPIVHRDIKPANIKVTSEGDIYLLDFGLARGAPGQEASSVHAFTAPYASLEQLQNSVTTPQSDVYSLGATLYHLLTGQVPIPASQRFEGLEEVDRDPLALAHEINSQVPEWLSEIISKSMAIRRRDRFASANEMKTALQAAQRDAAEAPTVPLPAPMPAPLKSTTPPADERKPESAEPKHLPTMPTPFVPQPLPGRVATDPIPAAETIAPYDSSPPGKPNHAMIAFAIIAAIVAITGLGIYWIVSPESGAQTDSAEQTAGTSRKPPISAPPAPAGMVYVPGGEFTMGRDDGDDYERPAHKVTVAPFFIDQYEVTCGDLADFIKKSGQSTGGVSSNACLENSDPKIAASEVTWDAAGRYCKWVSKRLPTEEEWEFAARGTDGRIYPWGNEWQQSAANAAGADSKPADGGLNKNGASPFGVYDMSGNVWEWTASKLTAYPGGTLPAQTVDSRVIRGGAYDSDQKTATTTYRRGYPARGNYDYSKTGFRCAKDVR